MSLKTQTTQIEANRSVERFGLFRSSRNGLCATSRVPWTWVPSMSPWLFPEPRKKFKRSTLVNSKLQYAHLYLNNTIRQKTIL